MLDNHQEEITTFKEIYIAPLKAGESTQLNINASFDYANAYDFTITKSK